MTVLKRLVEESMSTESFQLGKWIVNRSDEVVQLSTDAIAKLERLLNDRYLPFVRPDYTNDYGPNYSMMVWGIPSPVLRFDMSPIEGNAAPAIYEVEANPAGFGITEILCGRIGRPFVGPTIAVGLRRLGVARIDSAVAPSRSDQTADHEIFVTALRKADITVESIQIGNPHTGSPLWMRAGEEDLGQIAHLRESWLLQHRDGGGNKRYLVAINGARYLTDYPDAESLFDQHPDGLVLKPWRSWGTHDVFIYAPNKPWKERSDTRSRIAKQFERIAREGRKSEFIVQDFHPPTCHEKNFRIWRVYALWTPEGYKVIGGLWNERPSLLVHGASDSVYGPILMP